MQPTVTSGSWSYSKKADEVLNERAQKVAVILRGFDSSVRAVESGSGALIEGYYTAVEKVVDSKERFLDWLGKIRSR